MKNQLNRCNHRIISVISVNGFTIVELMVVAAVIAILVVLVVPNVLRARAAGNEAVAMASLKTINSATQLYYNNNAVYPQAFSDLVEPQSSPSYIDTELASGSKQGYEFIYQSQDGGSFSVNANPVFPGITGGKFFYMDETAIIHYNQNQAAGPDDPIAR